GMPVGTQYAPVSGIEVYCAEKTSSAAWPVAEKRGALLPPSGFSTAKAIQTPERSGRSGVAASCGGGLQAATKVASAATSVGALTRIHERWLSMIFSSGRRER